MVVMIVMMLAGIAMVIAVVSVAVTMFAKMCTLGIRSMGINHGMRLNRLRQLVF